MPFVLGYLGKFFVVRRPSNERKNCIFHHLFKFCLHTESLSVPERERESSAETMSKVDT